MFLGKRTQKLAPLIFPNKQLIRCRLRGYTATLMKSFPRIKMIKTENESNGGSEPGEGEGFQRKYAGK